MLLLLQTRIVGASKLTLRQDGLQVVKCQECKVPMDRKEVYDEVVVCYSWNEDIKEYQEVDTDFCGNTEIIYWCPNCGEEIVD